MSLSYLCASVTVAWLLRDNHSQRLFRDNWGFFPALRIRICAKQTLKARQRLPINSVSQSVSLLRPVIGLIIGSSSTPRNIDNDESIPQQRTQTWRTHGTRVIYDSAPSLFS